MNLQSISVSLALSFIVMMSAPCAAQSKFNMRTKLAKMTSTSSAAPTAPTTPSTCGTLAANSTVSNATTTNGRLGPYAAPTAADAVTACNKVAGARVCYYDVGGKNAYVFTLANQSSIGGGSASQMSSNCTAN